MTSSTIRTSLQATQSGASTRRTTTQYRDKPPRQRRENLIIQGSPLRMSTPVCRARTRSSMRHSLLAPTVLNSRTTAPRAWTTTRSRTSLTSSYLSSSTGSSATPREPTRTYRMRRAVKYSQEAQPPRIATAFSKAKSASYKSRSKS